MPHQRCLDAPESFTYDGNGNLVSSTDRKNQTSTFTYDPLNRRVRSAFADGAVAMFTYDAGGRLLQADDTADPHRPIVMAYDALDRLLAETTALGTVSHQCDALGRRIQMTVSGQAPVTYSYDTSSRLRTITQAPLNPVDIQYDALGRRTLLTLPNGVSTEYLYDLGSRLSALVYRNALDVLGDLTYQYDEAGNRIAIGGSFARTLLPDPVPSATYDSANRQLAFDSRTMMFDDNGNLAGLAGLTGTTTFTWDARNRLTAMSGSTINAGFTYDVQGRRSRKSINGQTTTFQYDGLDITREMGPGGDAAYLRTLRIDEALTRMDSLDTVHFLADALGSTVALTTATGGSITTYTYEPYGRTSVEGTPVNSVQYTGREYDGMGLYYYRARYYMPSPGRFVSEDPIGLAGGDINIYSYVRNNPTTYVDPLGLEVLLFGRQLPFFRLFPAQRPIPRPLPRVSPEPEPLEPPPWTPAPNPLPQIPRLHKPVQPGFPDLPPCLDGPCVGPGMSVPPLMIDTPPTTPPVRGPREKPQPRPEPETPPEWEACYRARICT